MSDSPDKIVVVTGARGFLGRHIARALADRGRFVVGLGRGEWETESWLTWGLGEWHECEARIENLLCYARHAAAIFHCAGGSSVGLSFESPTDDYRKTVEATFQVLEFIRVHSPKTKLVYPSSAGVYGRVASLPITEDSPLSPASPYGFHKKIAEDLVRSYSRHFNVSSAIIRYFSVYGPQLRKQLLYDACKKAGRGENVYPGTGDETRDWLHARDAAALACLAMDHASTDCPVVNGGYGESASVRQVIELIYGALLPGTPVEFNRLVRPGDPRDYKADISRAKGLGWKPTIPWRTGVEEYIDWFRQTEGGAIPPDAA